MDVDQELPSFKEVARDLGRRGLSFPTWLLGEPTTQNQHQARWRNKGSLCVIIAGKEAGTWFDHDPPAGGRAGGDAIALIAAVNGTSQYEAYKAGLEFLGVSVEVATWVESPTDRQKEEWAIRLWTQGRTIKETIGEKYLRSRGITEFPVDLKFHPQCKNTETDTHMPAMLALMRDISNDRPCGVHRTWLARDGGGKAALQTPKKMLGRAKNAVIKLCPNDAVTLGLGLSEGVETGLSLMGIGWRSIWAAGSAGAIKRFPILGGVEAITVFADNDSKEQGIEAARICAHRWRIAGRESTIIYPGAVGDDWNDALRGAA